MSEPFILTTGIVDQVLPDFFEPSAPDVGFILLADRGSESCTEWLVTVNGQLASDFRSDTAVGDNVFVAGRIVGPKMISADAIYRLGKPMGAVEAVVTALGVYWKKLPRRHAVSKTKDDVKPVRARRHIIMEKWDDEETQEKP